MEQFYVNKKPQPNGDHEVHRAGCEWLPRPENRIYLGMHYDCWTAVNEARKYFSRVNGCFYCCRPCHTS